jgi:hypothetical protein
MVRIGTKSILIFNLVLFNQVIDILLIIITFFNLIAFSNNLNIVINTVTDFFYYILN